MNRRGLILLLGIAVVATACDSNATTPAPSAAASLAPDASLALAQPSASPAPSAAASPSPSAPPMPTPSATTGPSATPAVVQTPPPPPPPPWKTYKSAKFRYSIKYPPTWVVTPGSSKRADQFDEYRYPYVYVSRDTVPGTLSMSLTVNHEIAYLKSHYKAKLSSNKPIRLAGYSGRLLVFTAIDDGQKVLIQEVILGKGSVGYFIVMWGELAGSTADRALFKKMYLTFRPR